MSPELLDTQVNPAVWEISGHMVLKRKEDYEGASEENAWRLLAEVSLSEERFQEVQAIIFEAIASSIKKKEDEDEEATAKSSSVEEPDDNAPSIEDVDGLNNAHQPTLVSV